ncbi:MAG: ComEC/Rec2 family competence protein [Planctomycetota bacterium]|nr:ComEC/Rec2 family competence protein [Planctomycetota bacterium]
MYRRPIFPIAVYLSLGAIFLRFAPFSRSIAIAAFLALSLISSRFLWRRKDRGLYLFLSILAFAVMFLRHDPPKPHSSQVQILSVVSKPRAHGRYRLSFRGRLERDRSNKQELITVIIDGPRGFFIRPGMKLKINAPVTRLGVSLSVLRVRWRQCKKSHEASSHNGQEAWQDWLGQSLASLPQPTQGLLKSALLGQKKELDRPTKLLFRRVGTAHLLAVSGLHVTLIAGVIFAVFRLTGARFRLQLFGALVATWLYVTLVGFRPATIRAALLLSCYLLSRCFGLRRDPWNILFFAASLLLIYRPDSLFDVGAQLSFASFSGLVFASSQVSSKTAQPSNLGEKCLTIIGKSWVFTAWAFLSSTPFVLYHFGTVEPTALLSNLPAVPLFSAFLAMGLLGTLLSAIHPLLGAPFLDIASMLASLLLSTLRAFDGLFPTISKAQFQPTVIVVPPLVALSSYFFWKQKQLCCALTCLVTLVTLVASIPRAERQVLEFVSGKQRAVKAATLLSGPITLRFDRSKLFLVLGQQERALRLDQTKTSRGQWRLGTLLMTKFSDKLWRFEQGRHSVLWVRGRQNFDLALKNGDFQPSSGLIVSTWLPRSTAKRLSGHWKGDWVLFQGIFGADLEAGRVIREERFQLVFGHELMVQGLKKQ